MMDDGISFLVQSFEKKFCQFTKFPAAPSNDPTQVAWQNLPKSDMAQSLKVKRLRDPSSHQECSN